MLFTAGWRGAHHLVCELLIPASGVTRHSFIFSLDKGFCPVSWIKLDDQIAHHPKFLKAGLSSWLWVCCIGFAQKFLTDGHIPTEAIATLAGGIDRPQNHIDKLVKVGLLDKVQGGYQVHDYLKFNDSAETVKRKREADRVRKESERNPRGIQAESDRNPESVLARAPASHPIPSHPGLDPIVSDNQNKQASKNGGNGHVRVPVSQEPKKDPLLDDPITTRAAAFIERYATLYSKHRNGAKYAKREARDWPYAVKLCETWTDDARLDKLAVCFLTTDHKFAENGSRTLGQFLSLASWVDGELAKWEKGLK